MDRLHILTKHYAIRTNILQFSSKIGEFDFENLIREPVEKMENWNHYS